jgi:hypothetical protein
LPAVSTLLALLALLCPAVGALPQPAGQARTAEAAQTAGAHSSDAATSSTWTLENKSTVAGLRGVACASASLCYAVGLTGTIVTAPASKTAPWTPQASGTDKELAGISCPSATVCYAVGNYGTILMRNGSSWTAQTSHTTSFLTGVTCPSVTTCYAVGTDNIFGPMTATVATTSDSGATWSLHTFSASAGGPAALFSVACTGAKTCYAVGTDTTLAPTKSFIETTVDGGQTWTQQTLKTPLELTGVSCPSATTCYAVGTDSNASPTTSYVMAATAQAAPVATWTLVQTFTVPALLLGVTCPRVGSCVAVGSNSYLAPTSGAIVSSQDVGPGGHWTVQTFTPPAGPKVLFGVTCGGVSSCYAVGDQVMAGALGGAATPMPTPRMLADAQALAAVALLVGKKTDPASRALAATVTAAVTKAVLARKPGTAALFAQPAQVRAGGAVVLGVSTDLQAGVVRYTITYGSGASAVVRTVAGMLNSTGYETTLAGVPALKKGAAKVVTATVQVTVTPTQKTEKPLTAKTTFTVQL